MIKTVKLMSSDIPNREQIERIKEASCKPVADDTDSPVYTLEQLTHLYLESKKLCKKQTVGIRLSHKTVEQYRNMGKGYTGIMAAVLDYAIKNPDVLRNAL